MIALIYKGNDTGDFVNKEVVGYVECTSLNDKDVTDVVRDLVYKSNIHVGEDGLVYPFFQVASVDKLIMDDIKEMG